MSDMWPGYKQIEHLGIIGRCESGDTLQLNLVSWYDRAPVYDIRRFAHDGKPRKGITLSREELINLAELINDQGW